MLSGDVVYFGMCGSVAQLVEQRPEEPCVVGSSPTGATKRLCVAFGLV